MTKTPRPPKTKQTSPAAPQGRRAPARDSHAGDASSYGAETLAHFVTIRDYLRWAVTRFEAAGLDYSQGRQTARAEAEYLLARSLGLQPEELGDFLDTRLLPEEKTRVLAALRQREIERKPAAYITHEAWFCGLKFYVDERVLIPRSLLEEFIEEGFQPWVDPNHVHRILDLCTGSGCIAISLAYAFQGAQVDAADISADALEVTRRNIAAHGVQDYVHPVQSDLFGNLQGRRYDLIVSNPPYVDAAAMAELPAEYHREPALALAAGDTGLDCVIPLLRHAAEHLTEHGVLVVEVGDSETALQQRYPDVPFLWLEHSAGGSGIFLLTAEQLREHAGRW